MVGPQVCSCFCLLCCVAVVVALAYEPGLVLMQIQALYLCWAPEGVSGDTEMPFSSLENANSSQ